MRVSGEGFGGVRTTGLLIFASALIAGVPGVAQQTPGEPGPPPPASAQPGKAQRFRLRARPMGQVQDLLVLMFWT